MASSRSTDHCADEWRMNPHQYSDGITNKSVLLLGPYPPPRGGISVHIARVEHKLQQQGNHVTVFDTIVRTSFIRYLCKLICAVYCAKPACIIYHTPYTDYAWVDLALLVLARWWYRASLLVVEHDCRYMAMRSWLTRWLYSILLRAIDHLIFIGMPTYESYHAARITLPVHWRLETPFLPPTESTRSLAAYPASLHNFITRAQPLIIANAYQCLLVNGVDIYGIDQCITLMQHVRARYAGAGLILALVTSGNQQYYRVLQEQITQAGLTDAVYILQGDYDLCQLFAYAHCFVRPTRSDNYGISVAEAVHYKVPAIASDVCERAPGAILYTTGAVDELIEKALHVLEQRCVHEK